MIEARQLSFRVRERELVRSLNLRVRPGEFTAILGPNGAGKSTLLKLLCGQIKPTTGTIFFAGKPLAEWHARDLAKYRAVLPQQSAVPFDFTALEVVLLGRSPYGDAGSQTELAREALRMTDSEHLADRVVTTLSGGELQRVQFARVLLQIGWQPVSDGRCLMLDEPISNLDPAHQHGALQVARDMARRGVTVLVVLHDLNLAAQYADHVILMKQGAIVAEGAPAEVMTAELIGEVFSVRARIAENPLCEAPAVFVELPPR